MDLWEVGEYIGETLVFFGVVGESFADSFDPKRIWLEKVSSVVLVIGLAISLAALIGTNKHFNQTIANLTEEAASSNEKAGKANERAEVLNREAEQLAKDTQALRTEAETQKSVAARALLEAGKANALAARESLEESQLELLVSPRRITLDQQRAIGVACTRLFPHSVIIESYGMDGEGAVLAMQIHKALVNGTSKVTRYAGGELTGGALDEGVLIQTPPESEEYGTCLADALTNIAGLKQVSVNGARHASSTQGNLRLLGNIKVFGGGSLLPAGGLAAGSPTRIFVGVKPAEMIEGH